MSQRHKTYDAGTIRARILGAFDQLDILADHTPSEHWYKRLSTNERAASVTTKQSLIKGFKQWAVDRGVEYLVLHKDRLQQGDDSVVDAARFAHVVELGRAADIGTSAHSAYDSYLQDWINLGGRPVNTCGSYLREGADPSEVCATRSFDRFLDEVEIIPVFSELRVFYSRGKDSWGGSIDGGVIARIPLRESGNKSCGQGSGARHDYARQPSGTLWCVICGRTCEEILVLADWKTSTAINNKPEYAEQASVYAKTIEYGAKPRFDEVWIVRFGKNKAEYEICKVTDRKRAFERFLTVSRAFDIRIDNTSMLESITKKETIIL